MSYVTESDHACQSLLVAFEGIDSAGKTTQIRTLANRLGSSRVHIIQGFSQSPSGKALKEMRERDWFMRMGKGLSLAESALFLSELVFITQKEINPRLSSGIHVLKDRYFLTSLSYQSCFLQEEFGIDPDHVMAIYRSFVRPGGMSIPDVTIVLRANIEVITQRIYQKDSRWPTKSEVTALMKVQEMMAVQMSRFRYLVEKEHKLILDLDTSKAEEETSSLIYDCVSAV